MKEAEDEPLTLQFGWKSPSLHGKLQGGAAVKLGG